MKAKIYCKDCNVRLNYWTKIEFKDCYRCEPCSNKKRDIDEKEEYS